MRPGNSCDLLQTLKGVRLEAIGSKAREAGCLIEPSGNLPEKGSRTQIDARKYSEVLFANKVGMTVCRVDYYSNRTFVPQTVFTGGKSAGLKKLTGFSSGRNIMCEDTAHYRPRLGYETGEVN